MDFNDYELDGRIYDEMFHSDGNARTHYQGVHKALTETSVADLGDIQDQVTGSFSSEGISFKVYGDEEGDERIIPVDCLPRVLSGGEWSELETGLTQRLKALNLFLADVYGPARIVEDGVIPVDVVRGCPQYRIEMRGFEAPHGVWVAICGTDLVRTNDGFKVLEDNLRVPFRRCIHARQPQGRKGQLPPPLPFLARSGHRALRARSAGNPPGTGARGNVRPVDRGADAGRLQLGLLRAHVSGQGNRRGIG